MDTKNLIVGIDVGVETGIAVFKDNKLIELHTKNVYETILYLLDNVYDIKKVVIEDSTKQSFIWNKKNKSMSALGRHARNIGTVDGGVRIIKEACTSLDIDLISVAPLQKGKKWHKKDFKFFFPEWTTQTNQHERDAVKCVYVCRFLG